METALEINLQYALLLSAGGEVHFVSINAKIRRFDLQVIFFAGPYLCLGSYTCNDQDRIAIAT